MRGVLPLLVLCYLIERAGPSAPIPVLIGIWVVSSLRKQPCSVDSLMHAFLGTVPETLLEQDCWSQAAVGAASDGAGF